MVLSAFNKDTAKNLQLGAGIICRGITNPLKPNEEELKTKCVGATEGGASFSATPEVNNLFDGLDDAVGKYKGGLQITSIEVKLSFTMKEMTAKNFQMAMGSADIVKASSLESPYEASSDVNADILVPRLDVKDEDFIDNICWYGVKKDGTKICIVLHNAYNEGGLTYSSESEGKGSLEVEMQAYFDLEDPTKVPYEIILFN